jgi:hypothetical protein
LRALIEKLIEAGRRREGEQPMLIVADASYDVVRLACLLTDLPVLLVARVHADRVYVTRRGSIRSAR